MKIVIPACGLGERFKCSGYETVKPLIPIYGKPMIDRVVEALSIDREVDEYVVVTNFPGEICHPTIDIRKETVGAVETVFEALSSAPGDNDSSLLVLDCDALYSCDVVKRFRALESEPEIRAGALSFLEKDIDKESSPKYSYVFADEDGRIHEIAEKKRVGPLANTGAYWFASAKEFQSFSLEILRDADKYEKGEAYISCVLREYIACKKRVQALRVREDEYSNVGTPEDLEKYLSKQGLAFLFDLDGTLVDTTSAYVQAWQALLAPRGAFVDVAFFLSHISGLADKQVEEVFKIAISSEEKDKVFLENISSVSEVPGANVFVRKCMELGLVCIVTNSNKSAAEALIRQMKLDGVPLICAQDVKTGKPDQEPFVKAMRLLGVSPLNCVVFEDSRGGYIAGRAAKANYVVAVANKLSGSDAFLNDYQGVDPNTLLDDLQSVSHLRDELSTMFEQQCTVYPVRLSGGYISEILSARRGSQHLVLKQDNSDHGILQDVSGFLHLHETECIFYESFSSLAPIKIPKFYGVLPKSRAIVLEDVSSLDRPPHFSLESGLKVVREVAKFHSHFLGAPLGRLSQHKPYMSVHVKRNYPIFKEKWKNTISPEVFALFDHAVKFHEDAEKRLQSGVRTLLHGDLKFPNLFWDKSVGGGEPLFIDWQYSGPGKGVEDIVFLIVESCEAARLKEIGGSLINAYYEERRTRDETEVPPGIRSSEVSCALAGFPLFVAVWFGCIDARKLAEPNFPFLYILRLANAFSHFYDVSWIHG